MENPTFRENKRIGHPSSEFPDILVLSDGKPGHYNQSLGIMDRIADFRIKLVEVRFKKKWRDNLLRVFTRLLWPFPLPNELIKAILSWAMEFPSFQELMNSKFSYAILSTGSSVAAPNLLMGKLTGKKTIVCTRPSPIGIKPFDLAILPEHSRPRKVPENVIMTIGVPNRITPEFVQSEGLKLAQKLGSGKYRVIGLLLGGDDPYYSITPAMTSKLCQVLLSICQDEDARLALTTSRRTHIQVENVIRSEMSGNPLCCLLIFASKPQKENPVPGIIGMSDVTIVTEDSFSMVCEAASSGHKIIILEAERKKNGDPKRQRVYEILMEQGYIKKGNISNLRDVILDLFKDNPPQKFLNDARNAADAIRKMLNV